MQNLMTPPRLLSLAGLLALALALPGCKSQDSQPLARKKVDLKVMLSAPKFTNLPPMVIECQDTSYNLGRDTSTSTHVNFYIGTDTNNPTSTNNQKLFIYGGGVNSRRVEGLYSGKYTTRASTNAYFQYPTNPPLKGRQYVIAKVVPGATDDDTNYKNNETSMPIDFGP